MSWQIARPRPVPAAPVARLARPRKNRWKIIGCSSAGMPGPLSDTTAATHDPAASCSARVRTVMCPWSGV